MKIEQTDIYARIHKGLRKALFEFSETAGKTDFENPAEIQSLARMGHQVFDFLELHAKIEEEFQLPLLDARDPALARQDHNEHLLLERIINCLKAEMSQLSLPGDPPDKGYRFYLQLNEFIGQYLLHMHHEELVTAGYFMEHCTSEEMLEVIGRINAYTSPREKILAMQYFMPAMSLPERVHFLKGVRRSSQQAYEHILHQTASLLDQEAFRQLKSAMESTLHAHS